jgi:6-phosphofructokinase 2
MPDVVTLTMNPAVDGWTSVDRIQAACKLRCGPSRKDAGGGGINVARAAQRLGARSTALYLAGGRTGEALKGLATRMG